MPNAKILQNLIFLRNLVIFKNDIFHNFPSCCIMSNINSLRSRLPLPGHVYTGWFTQLADAMAEDVIFHTCCI